MPITLATGDPAPRFIVPARHSEKFHFDAVGGRYIVLCFVGSLGHAGMLDMLRRVAARTDVFDNAHAAFFAVSMDPRDREERDGQIPNSFNLHLFWDFNGRISQRYGVLEEALEPGQQRRFTPASFILDPALRVLSVVPLHDPSQHAALLARIAGALPGIAQQARPAPVLVLPRVFEPEFCRALMDYYDNRGGSDSGFMRDDNGKTVGVVDYGMKRRRDCTIDDAALMSGVRGRIERRLVPEIQKSFNFRATRLERYIVACYDAGEGGYFKPHRDNTTIGTAHRRFAVTINLNPDEYDGGDLRFPEFGPVTYRAPLGGAVVFSCSLLHEALPVTRGRRYAVLPFLYDEEAHQQRERTRDMVQHENPLRVGAALETFRRDTATTTTAAGEPRRN